MDSALGHLVFSVKYEVIGDQEHLRLMLRYASLLFLISHTVCTLSFYTFLMSYGLWGISLWQIFSSWVALLCTLKDHSRQSGIHSMNHESYPETVISHSVTPLSPEHLNSSFVSKLDTTWAMWASMWVEGDDCRTLLTFRLCDIITAFMLITKYSERLHYESLHPSVKMLD